MHYGIDFACPVGTPIVASVTGKIVRAGWENPDKKDQGFGFRVWQYEPERDLFIVYAHLSDIRTWERDEVVAGERIGLSGNSGASSGPHLHQEARVGGIAGFKGLPFEYIEGVY